MIYRVYSPYHFGESESGTIEYGLFSDPAIASIRVQALVSVAQDLGIVPEWVRPDVVRIGTREIRVRAYELDRAMAEQVVGAWK